MRGVSIPFSAFKVTGAQVFNKEGMFQVTTESGRAFLSLATDARHDACASYHVDPAHYGESEEMTLKWEKYIKILTALSEMERSHDEQLSKTASSVTDDSNVTDRPGESNGGDGSGGGDKYNNNNNNNNNNNSNSNNDKNENSDKNANDQHDNNHDNRQGSENRNHDDVASRQRKAKRKNFPISFAWTNILTREGDDKLHSHHPSVRFEMWSIVVSRAIWLRARACSLMSPSGMPCESRSRPQGQGGQNGQKESLGAYLFSDEALSSSPGDVQQPGNEVEIPADAKEAYRALLTAASLFIAVADAINTDAKSSSGRVMNIVPDDIHPNTLKARAEQCIAEAQEITIAHAIRKGTSNVLIAAIASDTAARYSNAAALVEALFFNSNDSNSAKGTHSSLPPITPPTRVGRAIAYLRRKAKLLSAMSRIRSAVPLVEEDETRGIAIRSLREAINDLTSLSEGIPAEAEKVQRKYSLASSEAEIRSMFGVEFATLFAEKARHELAGAKAALTEATRVWLTSVKEPHDPPPLVARRSLAQGNLPHFNWPSAHESWREASKGLTFAKEYDANVDAEDDDENHLAKPSNKDTSCNIL